MYEHLCSPYHREDSMTKDEQQKLRDQCMAKFVVHKFLDRKIRQNSRLWENEELISHKNKRLKEAQELLKKLVQS